MCDQTKETLQLSLELWHPNCWTSEVNHETGAGVFGHGSVLNNERAFERCTIFGDSPSHVNDAISVAKGSSRIQSVREIGEAPSRSHVHNSAVGKFAQDVFIEYTFAEGIGPAFFTRGFALNGLSKMAGETEIWPLLATKDRQTLHRILDEIRDRHDADITVKQISPVDQENKTVTFSDQLDSLTPRQREAFETARENGYYTWPRETSIKELANELGVSKPTFLEHLRNAESQLLDPAKES